MKHLTCWLLLTLWVCLLDVLACRPLETEDSDIYHNNDITSEDVDAGSFHSDDVESGSRRQPRRFSVRRRIPAVQAGRRIPAVQSLVYPPVNFLANGRPSKLFINNQEFKLRPPPPPTSTLAPAVSKADDISLEVTTPTPTISSLSNSPLTWLTGHFPFNGLPSNIFYFGSPAPSFGSPAPSFGTPAATSKLPSATPVTWLGGISSRLGGMGSGINSMFRHSTMPSALYLG